MGRRAFSSPCICNKHFFFHLNFIDNTRTIQGWDTKAGGIQRYPRKLIPKSGIYNPNTRATNQHPKLNTYSPLKKPRNNHLKIKEQWLKCAKTSRGFCNERRKRASNADDFFMKSINLIWTTCSRWKPPNHCHELNK